MESPPRVLPWHPPGTSPSQNPAPSSTATISTRLLPTGPVRQARAQHRTRPMDTATRSEKHSLRRRRPLRRQAEVSLFCFGGILTHPARLHRADASLGRRRLHLCGGSTRSGQRRCLADLSRLQLAWPPPGVVNATAGRRDRSCARARNCGSACCRRAEQRHQARGYGSTTRSRAGIGHTTTCLCRRLPAAFTAPGECVAR
jgi:hypothetical protein